MAQPVKETRIDSRASRARLEPRAKPYWKSLQPGLQLGYRRNAKGGVWVARWSVGGGGMKVQSIAPADDLTDADGNDVLNFAQAIERAKEAHRLATNPDAAVAQVPAKVTPPGTGMTVREACADYVAHLLGDKGAAAARDTLQRLRRHVDPEIPAPEKLVMQKARKAAEAHAKLGKKVINDLTLGELEKWRNALVVDSDDPEAVRRSKDTANRVISMLKAALNLAIRDDANKIVTDKAWRLLTVFDDVGRARHVHLDAAQVKRLINACEGGFRNLVVGLLLTGMRSGIEPRHIRVRHFSKLTSTLHIPESKTGPRDVVLTEEGVEFFQELTAGRHPDEWMFTRDDGSQWGDSDHFRPMRAAVEKAKLPADTVMYSLRHTYASQSIMAGMQAQLLAENMGTSVRMLEQNYGKFFASARRQLIEAAAPKLGLVKGNVVPLRAG